jgi:hypothetical protein
MTLNQPSSTDTNSAPRSSPEHTPRLRLKPKGRISGSVDGAWWPHSDDLATQLPDLLAVLSVRLGPIDRVLFNVNEWATPPRKLSTGGRAVRLDGYQRQPVHTIEDLGFSGGGRIALLVVPADSDPDEAHATLMAAATPHDTSTVDGLLLMTARHAEQTRKM